MRWLVLLVGLALVAGCGDDDQEDRAARAPSFEDTPWVLASGLDAADTESVAPSATFSDGHIAGFSGCNRYTAPYTLDGDSLQIGDIASTQMACVGPGDAVERAYLAALGRVANVQVEGDELVLLDSGGTELLRFREPSPAGDWTVTAFLQGDAVSSPILGTEITASFSDDGTLTGSGGCNRYQTTFKTDRGAIEIAQPSASLKACVKPAGVMEQEHAYLSALPLAAEYRVDGEMLSLLTADGTIVATYTRTPMSPRRR